MIKTAYAYDESGYFSGTTAVQEDPLSPGSFLLPPRATLVEPALADGFFYRWDGEAWQTEKVPTEAADFEGVTISHASQTPHDQKMRQLIQQIVGADCKTHRIVRGDDMSWSVEPIPEKTADEVRGDKLTELDSAFMSWYETDATVTSSLGFVADSDQRAMMDINGLVTTLGNQPGGTTVAFMDANNEPHMLDFNQLTTLQNEVILNGQDAYQQKWALRQQIESAETVDALNAIEIKFTGLDFSA